MVKYTNQKIAAAKSGMSESSARKYLKIDALPSEMKKPRHWRTRSNAFEEVWGKIESMVSLACKATTQGIIIGKLSAHARKNKTKQALWEYDNIIRSLHLLDYVDSPPLRRYIQKALNRTESYHKLRRAIAIANGGKLRFKTETEQEIWNECSRLIANCIIHYNAAILSNMLDLYEKAADTVNAEWIKQISPVAWQHINLYGRYEFQKIPDPINLENMIAELTLIKSAPQQKTNTNP